MDNTKKTKKSQHMTGTVVAVSTTNTVKVEVPYMKTHPLYRKSLKRTRAFACHCTLQDVKTGDTVEISQIRPMSKTKYFEIIKKV